MRVRRSKDGEGLTLESVSESELAMLRAVRDAADPASCPEAEKRLFPESVEGKDDEAFDAAADWKEFVVPDLRTQFHEALDQFESDLKRARKKRIGLLARYQVDIPMSHVEQWFSALNQARLVLQEKFGLPGENERLSLEDMFARGQWRAYFQSRFYAELQCWLLELGSWL